MEKKTYYVTVSTGEVLDSKENINYDFEIMADQEELDQLQELFEETDNTSQNSYGTSYVPWNVYYNNEANEEYDYFLTEVYRMIHKLGTQETRNHIESMHILENGI